VVEVLVRRGVDLPDLRLWVSSGEPLSAALAQRLRSRCPNATVVNLYGMSEVAADSTFHKVADEDTVGMVPIGRPIDNTRVYIVSPWGKPCPVGVKGELYIGGPGVAIGYVNRDELTRKKFVPDPVAPEAGTVFRTGDFGRYRPDGTIE